jgi:vitamin B12 transporter
MVLLIGVTMWNGWSMDVRAQTERADPSIDTASADTPQNLEVVVDPVVVSETRTERRLSQSTGSVHVITRDELEKRHFPYLREVLRDVPGLAVVQTGSRGGTTSLFTRGGESDFTMVMVDGVKMNDPGGGFEFANLTTDNVERIEIVKGPQSALYGSDAIGGVINIITRKGTGPLRVTGEVMGGAGRGIGSSMVTHQQRLGVSGASERLDFSGEWSRIDHGGTFGLNNRFKNNVFSGSFGFKATEKLQLRSTLRYTDSEFQFPTDFVFGQGYLPVDPNQGNERTLFSFANSATYRLTDWWDHSLQWSHLESRFKFFDLQDTIPTDAFGTFNANGTNRRDMVDYHTNFRVNDGLFRGTTATAGVEWQQERFSQSGGFGTALENTNLSRGNMGYYAQVQGVLWDRFFLTPGVRVEDNEFFGTFVNPKVSGAYVHKETGTKIRGSFGRGIRAPAFTELVGFPGFGIPSNFALRPEKATSWEIGLEQDLLDKRLSGSVTWFHNDFTDLIALSTGLNTNIQGADTEGLESSLRWRATNELTFSVSHTYLKTEVTEVGAGQSFDGLFTPGARLLRRPEHSGNVRVDYQANTWGVNFTALGVGDRVDRDFAAAGSPRVRNKAYWRADLAAWYLLGRFEGSEWRAKLRIENMTNTRYQEAFGFPNPGIFAMAGVEVRY